MTTGKGSLPQHVTEDQGEVIAFLADPATHGGRPVTRIDTQSAVVFLADADAYKLKRAVRFPFMDLSSAARRRAACEAEIAVNRASAPSIYRGVVGVGRRVDGRLAIGGGAPVDWLVHMRRFDEALTLDRVAAAGDLDPNLVRDLVAAIVASHERAPRGDPAAALASLASYVGQNADAFTEWSTLFPPERARNLETMTQSRLRLVADLLMQRGERGFVRRCHGDLHLRNIVLIDGRPTLFDAIEFDDAIATGDVLYDLAFLLMDLRQRGLRGTANLVLNRYLWLSRDDEDHLQALAAMPLFLSIRAALRAKVEAAGTAHVGGRARVDSEEAARAYFAAAEGFLRPPPPVLVAIGGLSGTGKSTLAAAIAAGLGPAPGAIHLRSDIERKRVCGVAETDRLPQSAYADAITATVYDNLRRKAAAALAAGQAVIVDAVHAEPAERSAVAAIGASAGVPFRGLWLEAPAPLLMARVGARTGDASDADAAVVSRQLDYDLGEVGWTRLDAGRDLPDLRRQADAALAPTLPAGQD